MSGIIIKVDDAMLKEVQRKLGEIPEKAPNVISSSLNRTITNVASNLSKEVRKEYTIKAGDVKSTIQRTGARPNRLSAVVKSIGGVIPLDKFKTSAMMSTSRKGGVKSVALSRRPVRVAVKKGGMKTVLGGFVANVNGPKIFKRTSKKRLPIERLFGPSVPQMAGEPGIVERVNEQAKEMFDRRLEADINNLLRKLGG